MVLGQTETVYRFVFGRGGRQDAALEGLIFEKIDIFRPFFSGARSFSSREAMVVGDYHLSSSNYEFEVV